MLKTLLVIAVLSVAVHASIDDDLKRLEADLRDLTASKQSFLGVNADRCGAAGGVCKDVAQCGGQVKSGLCDGGNNIKCCISSNGNGGDASVNTPTQPPAAAPGLSAPYLPTQGGEGEAGGPCQQAQRGRCGPASECNTSAGYRIQSGRCKGSSVCCTPKNAGGQNDVIPSAFFEKGKLCYPITQDTFERTGSDYGSGRPVSGANRMKRCHSGQDIFTKRVNHDNVVAVADGEITITPSGCFTNCGDGWGLKKNGGKTTSGCAGNLLVYHPSIDRTINYGEIDAVNIRKKHGTVTKGEKLGVASVCGMLHFEIYKGRQSRNFRWYPTRECESSTASCTRPSWAEERNMCAIHSMNLKNPVNLDPRPYLDLLDPNNGNGSWC